VLVSVSSRPLKKPGETCRARLTCGREGGGRGGKEEGGGGSSGVGGGGAIQQGRKVGCSAARAASLNQRLLFYVHNIPLNCMAFVFYNKLWADGRIGIWLENAEEWIDFKHMCRLKQTATAHKFCSTNAPKFSLCIDNSTP
jgi:hypothetical protein